MVNYIVIFICFLFGMNCVTILRSFLFRISNLRENRILPFIGKLSKNSHWVKKERFWHTTCSIIFENDFKFKINECIFPEKCVEQLIFCEASEIVTDILKHLYLNVECPHHECKDQQEGATPWTVIPNTNIDFTRLRNLRDL